MSEYMADLHRNPQLREAAVANKPLGKKYVSLAISRVLQSLDNARIAMDGSLKVIS